MEKDADELTASLTTITALAASAAASWLLLSANISMRERTIELRGRSTEVSPLGSLRGWQVGEAIEWTPSGEVPHVVIFLLSAPRTQGDLDFWREIARTSKKEGLDLQFVGVCTEKQLCDIATAADDGITLLDALDPLQWSSISMASESGMALVYRGTVLQSKISIATGTRAIADQLSRLAKASTKQNKLAARQSEPSG